MQLELTFQLERDHLSVTVVGEADPDRFREAMATIAEEARKAGQTRLLVDALGLGAPKREFHRYLAGEYMAEYLQPPIRAGIVYPREFFNRFGETTAVNRGACLKVYGTVGEALAWLNLDGEGLAQPGEAAFESGAPSQDL